MKEPFIEIVDAKGGFRVRSIAKNGEVLQTSEVLESSAAVNKHLMALRRLWDPAIFYTIGPIVKRTPKYKPSKTIKAKFFVTPPKK